jgi:hypothetical protein
MPKMCPKCHAIHSGVAVKCECGFDLTGVAASGPVASTPPLPPTGAIKVPVGQLIGLVGCVLVVLGGLLPLQSINVRRELLENGSTAVEGIDRNWYAVPGIGNAVLGLAFGGAVLLAVRHPSGATAAGAGLVAFVLPVPSQVTTGEFGWFGWCVVVAGGVLLTIGGGIELRRQAREDRFAAEKSARAGAAPDPAA